MELAQQMRDATEALELAAREYQIALAQHRERHLSRVDFKTAQHRYIRACNGYDEACSAVWRCDVARIDAEATAFAARYNALYPVA